MRSAVVVIVIMLAAISGRSESANASGDQKTPSGAGAQAVPAAGAPVAAAPVGQHDAGSQNGSIQTVDGTGDTSIEARVAALEKRVAALARELAEYQALTPGRGVEVASGDQLASLQAENRRLRAVIARLAAAGVPWVSYAADDDGVLAKKQREVDALLNRLATVKKKAREKKIINDIKGYGIVAVYAIQRALTAMPNDARYATFRGRLELLLAQLVLRTQSGVTAKVLDAQPRAGLVVLNVGSARGVREGNVFSLTRDGEFLGLVSVDQVYTDVCRAKNVGGVKPVRPGDTATSRMPEMDASEAGVVSGPIVSSGGEPASGAPSEHAPAEKKGISGGSAP